MHEIKILRSSATVTELTMGNLLTKREKTQYRDKRSPEGCFGRLFRKKNSKVSYTGTVYTRENKAATKRKSEALIQMVQKRMFALWFSCILPVLVAFCRS